MASSSKTILPTPKCTCQRIQQNGDANHDAATNCMIKNYKPHGSFARLLWEKQRADERLHSYDKSRVSLIIICLLFFFLKPLVCVHFYYIDTVPICQSQVGDDNKIEIKKRQKIE